MNKYKVITVFISIVTLSWQYAETAAVLAHCHAV